MDATRTMQLALGYWPARAFSAAGELGVYELLARGGALDAATIGERLGIRSRSLPELLGALVELGVLIRSDGMYDLAGDVPDGEILAMADAGSLRAWADLPVILREGRRSGASIYEELAADRVRLEAFADLMAQVSTPARDALVQLDLADVRTLCDIGGADGRLAVAVAEAHPHVQCITFDLPAYVPLIEARAAAGDVHDRVSAVGGDFFTDALPSSDMLVLSLVLLDWDEEEKLRLLVACRDALEPNGRLVIVDRLTEDDNGVPSRRAFDFLRSLHFLVLLGEAHRFGAADLERWLTESGLTAETSRPLRAGCPWSSRGGGQNDRRAHRCRSQVRRSRRHPPCRRPPW